MCAYICTLTAYDRVCMCICTNSRLSVVKYIFSFLIQKSNLFMDRKEINELNYIGSRWKADLLFKMVNYCIGF